MMNKNNILAIGICSIIALVASLPLEWMEIRNTTLNFGGATLRLPAFGNANSLSVTGINGSVTFLAKLPIWAVVLVGVVGVALASLNRLTVTTIPKIFPILLISFSGVFVTIALVVSLLSQDASVGIGGFVALIGIALGVIQGITLPMVSEAQILEAEGRA